MEASIIHICREGGVRGDTTIEFTGTIVISGEGYTEFDRDLQALIEKHAI